MDHGRRPGRVEERGVPVGLPAHPVRRAAVRLVTLQDLTHPFGLPLVGGVDDDAVSDMSFHGSLRRGVVCITACPSRRARSRGRRTRAARRRPVRADPHRGLGRWSNAANRRQPGRQRMAQYVQLGTVRTWYDEHGDGEPLVLMHGGLTDSRFLEPNLGPLAERFHVYTPDRRGHGRTPDVDGPITYQLMADDTISFLEQVVGGPAHLVGHSDGAVVAMLVAMQRPELVRRLAMISGGFDKSGEAVPDMEFDSDEVVHF